MTSNPCPQNIWNHTDGCTCTPNGAVTAEAEVDLSTQAVETPAYSAVGDCPDCGQPMLGHAGDGKFAPGAECGHCHHLVGYHEWEGTGLIGEPVTYSLRDYVYIHGESFGEPIAPIEPSDERWADMVREQGYDPDALMRGNLSFTDAHLFVDRETERLGYAHLGEPYGILLQREHVPLHAIIARASDPDGLAEDDQEIERAIDDLRDPVHEYEYGEDYEFTPEDWKHVETACREADLPVMLDFYESMVNRDILTTSHVIDADTVDSDYQRVVAPAIDRIEDRLVEAHGDANPPAEPDPNDVEHNFAGWRKVPSKRGGLKSPKCTCGWEGAPGLAVDRMSAFEAHQKNPSGD